MPQLLDAAALLDAVDVRARVDKALGEFLDAAVPEFDAVGSDLSPLMAAAQDFLLDSGKRLRPAFAYWGWRAAGAPDNDAIIRAAASLELVHACALVHDDVMDGSDTRRGRPAVHRRFAALHRGERWHGAPEGFGMSAAILLGDIFLVWAETMLRDCGLPPGDLLRAKPVYDTMRIELMAGQYLDVLEQASGTSSVDRALRVARYKTAKYTVERPLHLGASLAGASDPALRALSRYGLPLGEAFQLRDDVLGVFGDPSQTGKPAGDDLREGKRTVLIAEALAVATPAQRALVSRLLGDPALDASGVAALREVLVDTGALDVTERRITRGLEAALDAVDAAAAADLLDPTSCRALRELAVAATARAL